jgi:hypothetical protein
MEMMSEVEGVDRINNEYIHKERNVTIDVQKWVYKTLDDPVDLHEYIQVNIHGMETARWYIPLMADEEILMSIES